MRLRAPSHRGQPNPSEDASTDHEDGRQDLFWWVVALGFLVVLVAINLWVARTGVAPRTPYDEIGVLQASRFFAGQDDIPRTLSLGYYPGAGLFFAPVWWFTQDAATVYTVAVHINILLGLLTVVPLAFLGCRLGLTRPQAVAAAAVVMLLPARTALSDYVLAEQALALLAAWAVVAAFRLWDRPTLPNLSWFVGAVLAAYFTHARALVLVLVAGVWLVLFIRRRWSVGLGGVAMLGVGAWATSLLAEAIVSRLVVDGFGQGSSLLDKVMSLGGIFARVAFVQTWSQLAATAGLVMIGAVLLTMQVFRDLVRDRAVGPHGFVWGLAVAGALLSFIAWSGPTSHAYGTEPRFDSWTYTRYIDPFVTAVVLVALVAIIRRVDRRIVIAALVPTVAIIAGTLLWAISIVTTWGSNYGPGNNAGIYPLLRYRSMEPFDLPQLPSFTNDNRIWAFGSVLVVAALLSILVFAAWPKFVFVSVGVAMVVLSYRGDPSQHRDAPYALERGVEVVDSVADRSSDVTMLLACPVSSQRNVAANWVGYWFSDRSVTLIDDKTQLGEADTVIACTDWENPTGAPRVADSFNYGYSLFVLDPDLVESLEDDGIALEQVPVSR